VVGVARRCLQSLLVAGGNSIKKGPKEEAAGLAVALLLGPLWRMGLRNEFVKGEHFAMENLPAGARSGKGVQESEPEAVTELLRALLGAANVQAGTSTPGERSPILRKAVALGGRVALDASDHQGGHGGVIGRGLLELRGLSHALARQPSSLHGETSPGSYASRAHKKLESILTTKGGTQEGTERGLLVRIILRLWLQGGRRENPFREWIDREIDRDRRHPILHNNGPKDHTVALEACDMAGSLALAAATALPGSTGEARAPRSLERARGLMRRCQRLLEDPLRLDSAVLSRLLESLSIVYSVIDHC